MAGADPISLPDATTGIGTLAVDIVRGGLRKRHWWHVLAVTAQATVGLDTEHLQCSSNLSGSSGYAILLPHSSAAPGQTIIISTSAVLDSGHTITITPASGDTVDGSSTLTITAINKFVVLQADGASNWILLHDGR